MRYILSLILITLLICCDSKTKPSVKKEIPKDNTTELSYIEQLAIANGFKHWDDVKELHFSFNVNNQGKEFKRDWKWQVQKDKIFMNVDGEEVGIDINKNPDQQIHQAFINDTYWLLFPFQLMWTDGYDHEIHKTVVSPFHEKELTELVIRFKEEGGYTPGDSYKLYVNKDFKIEEWSFYPAGSNEPRIINAWDNYKTYDGINISTDRRNADGSFRIYFTEIAIKK
ncbi:hypothetical protein [Psychroflexus salis]|uniref:Uncharacterized protein n=1 Tax=Psychroflexus salis TaxID=1526574 RepID=A0A917E9E8_9FLAO|nr:hypothetical protein [Psychroflexus salis]GGE17145.1 hypothetical protein GCM10010831_18010 [Psychroflexus salis]